MDGGVSSVGIVTLTGPAPAGGIVVQLSTNVFYIVNIQDSLTISAGSSTGSFTIYTQPFFFTWPATITATYGGISQSSVLTVGDSLNFDW